MLQRMNELSIKAANGTNTVADRAAIRQELSALVEEIDRVQTSTQFNTQNLLNGEFKSGKVLQVGAASGTSYEIKIVISNMSASAIGITASSIMVDDKNGSVAKALIAKVTKAIASVSRQRSALGAIQNRLEHTIANLDNVVENTTAAESRIRDTDMAAEMVTYSKNNILAQAGQSMLAQANQSNQGVLSLLG